MRMQLHEAEIASYTGTRTSNAKCWEATVSFRSNFAMKDLGAKGDESLTSHRSWLRHCVYAISRS
jgi:hypothetical protein